MKRIVIIILLIAAGVVLFFIPNEDRIDRVVVAVGLKVPEFELPEIEQDGKNPSRIWRSTELRGKVVFINFWASWCKECKKEKPSMQRLYEMMQGKPFQMITILYRDNPEKAIAYMKANGFTMPVLFDKDNQVSYSYGVTGVPETYILDREGIIKKKHLGVGVWDSPEALGFIENLLK
jgi:DsbE subfamily thiol:disulfide oxidoreductase